MEHGSSARDICEFSWLEIDINEDTSNRAVWYARGILMIFFVFRTGEHSGKRCLKGSKLKLSARPDRSMCPPPFTIKRDLKARSLPVNDSQLFCNVALSARSLYMSRIPVALLLESFFEPIFRLRRFEVN